MGYALRFGAIGRPSGYTLQPTGEQGGLAEASGGDDEGERHRQGGVEVAPEPHTRQRPDPGWGNEQLGQQQRAELGPEQLGQGVVAQRTTGLQRTEGGVGHG